MFRPGSDWQRYRVSDPEERARFLAAIDRGGRQSR
jgi:hypothetical protein